MTTVGEAILGSSGAADGSTVREHLQNLGTGGSSEPIQIPTELSATLVDNPVLEATFETLPPLTIPDAQNMEFEATLSEPEVIQLAEQSPPIQEI